jgi:hypothetical protein
MKYLLLIYGDENAWTDDSRRECMVDSIKVCDELAAQGKMIATSPLHPVHTARTVRLRNGKSLVTDGPFAETTEQLGGFFLLELENLDEAIAVAGRLPPTKVGTCEIRPAAELEGLPAPRPIREAFGRPGLKPYMMISYDNEAHWEQAGPAALDAAKKEAAGIACDLDAHGRYLMASPLHPVATATSVRIRDGKRHITDGPFAETNEVVGGFYVILAESPEHALKSAERHAKLNHGSVEVRELFDYTPLKDPGAKW